MCTVTNIPLSKTDHAGVRKFLDTTVRNGGAIPGSKQLQEHYLNDVYKVEWDLLKEKLNGVKVAVTFDESSDFEMRCVHNILIAPLVQDENGRVKTYLADTVFMNQTNHTTVSQAVVNTIQKLGSTL